MPDTTPSVESSSAIEIVTVVVYLLGGQVAFSEYAIGLAHEMDQNGEFIEPSEAMVEIRNTLNRMARRSASLYAS